MRTNADALFQSVHNDLSGIIDPTVLTWGPDLDARQVACYMLLGSIVKKYQSSKKTTQPQNNAALSKFLAANEKCSKWTLVQNTSIDEVLIGEFRRSIAEFFDSSYQVHRSPLSYDYGYIYRNGRCGPGASIGARDDDLYTKWFDSPLSVSSRLKDIWEIINHPRTVNTLSRSPSDAEAESFRARRYPLEVSDCSMLSFVPKTTTTARSICTEPSVNMWMQLGLGSLIERRLTAFFGVDIAKQEGVNRELARIGSLDDTLSTIDLESASDSISLRMLQELLPRQVVSILEVLRCPSTAAPDNRRIQLHMVSSMGNGFTFPLMTAILCCVVAAVYRTLGIPLQGYGVPAVRNFGVYGDDMIVLRESIPRVFRLLGLLGFTVNGGKSFVDGPFKESCGADYFKGVNVRGVYCKRLRPVNNQVWFSGKGSDDRILATDVFVLVNRLNAWSVQHNVQLRETISLCLGWLGPRIKDLSQAFVPLDESDDSGLKVPLCYVPYPRRTKFGHVKYTLRTASDDFNHYVVSGDFVWTYKQQVCRHYNPSGLLQAFLHGSLRDGFVSLRPRRYRLRTTRKTTVRWDYAPPDKYPVKGTILSLTRLWADYLL